MRSMLLMALLLVAGCKNPLGPVEGGIGSGLGFSSTDVARHVPALDSVATAPIADSLSVSTEEGD
jgi:hypothetical protein